MTRRSVVHGVLRIAVAVLAVVAITYQLARLQAHPSFRGAGNFFSFFTIQSNMLAAAMLTLAALVRRPERSLAFEVVRGAATFYIAITGVVFALFLSGLQEQLDTHNTFVNSVVHYVVPAVAVVDWFVEPPQRPLATRLALAWLAYPLAWFVYTLVRGSVVHWYPYPFVDGSGHGYGGVLLRGVIFLVAVALGAFAFLQLTTRRQRLGAGELASALSVR